MYEFDDLHLLGSLYCDSLCHAFSFADGLRHEREFRAEWLVPDLAVYGVWGIDQARCSIFASLSSAILTSRLPRS